MKIDYLDMSWADCVAAAVLVVLFLYQLYFYIRYIAAVGRRMRKEHKQNSEQTAVPMEQDSQLDLFGTQVRGVSVIVCAKNEEKNLQDYLPSLLEQDYPMYEVIVVNDGSEDGTQFVINDFVNRYPHCRTTFVPKQARVISSKKLAITLGIKAARYDNLLFTDADCRPVSNQWISAMVQGLNEKGKTIVLGFGAYFSEPTLLNALITYDTLFNGLQYMGLALAGKPYMGVGRNLMYSKQLFMEHNGFAGILGERAGDDDLFVNKVADKTNTAVVTVRDSLTWSPPKTSWKSWLQQKRRHVGVSPKYNDRTKRMLGLEPVTRGLWYISLIAAFAFGDWQVGALAWLLMALRLGGQMAILNAASKRWGGRTWGPEILWLDIVLPLITLWMLLTNRCKKRNQYW